MTSLLDNELVREYFSCEANEDACGNRFSALDHMSRRILESMEQPIIKGERYLNLQGPNGNNEAFEAVNDGEWFGFSEAWHPSYLRLPNSFQPKKPTVDPREAMEDFKWCGYDQKEMRSMRDFALSQGWKPPVQANAPERCCDNGAQHVKPYGCGWKATEYDCGLSGHPKGCVCLKPDRPSPADPLNASVEEKIKEIINEFKWSGTPHLRKVEALRELMALARKGQDR